MTKADHVSQKTRKRKLKKRRAIDVFSGAGGLTEGLKQAGFDVIGAIEINPLASETYKQNHPYVHVWERDICSIPGEEILKKLKIGRGDLDLLAGCPPCQGFSGMRTLNGGKNIVDARNDLVYEFLRLIEELLPKTVMMENVPALAKDKRIDEILIKLSELGYNIDDPVHVRNVKDFGVPQRRRRMILLSSRFGRIEFPKKNNNIKTVRQTIESLPSPGQSGDPLHDYPEIRSDKVKKLIELIPKDGGSRSALGDKQLECHKKEKVGFFDVYGRMKWDDVSPTITGGCTNPSKGRFLHPTENRAITLREAALLQDFPQTYFFSLKKGKGAASLMIGNALPPSFVKMHASAILSHLVNDEGEV